MFLIYIVDDRFPSAYLVLLLSLKQDWQICCSELQPRAGAATSAVEVAY